MQIDIFAFGMTVYEMLSLRVPFDDVKAIIKRNHEVKSGGRPTLKGKVCVSRGEEGEGWGGGVVFRSMCA